MPFSTSKVDLTSTELREIARALKLRADYLYANGEKEYAQKLYNLVTALMPQI